MLNALSFNLEEYFHADNVRRFAPPDQPPASRLDKALDNILEELRRTDTHATFFITGALAHDHPHLIRDLTAAGHEIAAQIWQPVPLLRLTPDAFQKQLRQTKTTLEDIAAQRVLGFRAPHFSMVKKTLWTLDLIANLGFEYDSSIFPIKHERFGIPGSFPNPHLLTTLEGQTIAEFPPLTIGRHHRRIPIGGCPYLRFIPGSCVRFFIRRRNSIDFPALVFFNSWEFDSAQPRCKLPFLHYLTQYHNLRHTPHILASLLQAFTFAPLRDVLRHHPPQRPPAADQPTSSA